MFVSLDRHGRLLYYGDMSDRHIVDTVTLDLLASAHDDLLEMVKEDTGNYRLAQLLGAVADASDSYYRGEEAAFFNTAKAAALAKADGDIWTAEHLHLAGARIIKERIENV